jgi:hypothetical protein
MVVNKLPEILLIKEPTTEATINNTEGEPLTNKIPTKTQHVSSRIITIK